MPTLTRKAVFESVRAKYPNQKARAALSQKLGKNWSHAATEDLARAIGLQQAPKASGQTKSAAAATAKRHGVAKSFAANAVANKLTEAAPDRQVAVRQRIVRAVDREFRAEKKKLGRSLTVDEKRKIAAKALHSEVQAIKAGKAEVKAGRGGKAKPSKPVPMNNIEPLPKKPPLTEEAFKDIVSQSQARMENLFDEHKDLLDRVGRDDYGDVDSKAWRITSGDVEAARKNLKLDGKAAPEAPKPDSIPTAFWAKLNPAQRQQAAKLAQQKADLEQRAQGASDRIQAARAQIEAPNTAKPDGQDTLDLSNGGENREGHITTTSYRNKGSTGYLARISVKPDGSLDRQFQSTASQDRKTYQGKEGNHHYKLAALPDGIYEAESKKVNRGVDKHHFEVKSGVVTRHFDDLDHAKQEGLGIAPAAQGLPDLKGSDKQVSWASSLRERAIAEAHKKIHLNVPPEHHAFIKKHLQAVAAEQTSAKHWIDNRDKPAWLLQAAQERARAELAAKRG